MVYMLPQRLKIELYRPFGACIEGTPLVCRVVPFWNKTKVFAVILAPYKPFTNKRGCPTNLLDSLK